jgi:hypothetical protein
MAVSQLYVADIVATLCRQPKWTPNQTILKSEPSYEQVIFPLDESHDNFILTFNNALNRKELDVYLAEAVHVERPIGRAPYGALKPRKELCYSADGQEYIYSGIPHQTTFFPQHILPLVKKFQRQVEDTLNTKIGLKNIYTVPTSISDLQYDDSFPQGGSCGEHKDDEKEWGMVIIFSLGQTRWLRIRSETDSEKIINVQMVHNSLVVMYGRGFFEEGNGYTHKVDKLHPDEDIRVRLSLNIRFEA